MKKLRGTGGFTLIELVVVLVILTVVASVTIPTFAGQTDKGNDYVCETNRENLKAQILIAAQVEGTSADEDALNELLQNELSDLDYITLEDSQLACPACGEDYFVKDGAVTGTFELLCEEHGGTPFPLTDYSYDPSVLTGVAVAPPVPVPVVVPPAADAPDPLLTLPPGLTEANGYWTGDWLEYKEDNARQIYSWRSDFYYLWTNMSGNIESGNANNSIGSFFNNSPEDCHFFNNYNNYISPSGIIDIVKLNVSLDENENPYIKIHTDTTYLTAQRGDILSYNSRYYIRASDSAGAINLPAASNTATNVINNGWYLIPTSVGIPLS